MKKQLFTLVVALTGSFAMTAVAASGGSDQEKLQGTWELTKITYNDMVFPLEKDRMLLVIQGNQATHLRGEKTEDETTFRLDEKKKPKTITFAKTAKEKEIRGIYQVEGNTLTIGIIKPGSPPPTAFEDKETLVFKFKKADKEKK